MIINIKNCIEELNEFIKTKNWFEEVPNKDVEPFKIVNQNIIFDRRYGQNKYLKLQIKEIEKRFLNKINNEQTRREILKYSNKVHKRLDIKLIEVIDNILKTHNIDNIIFENVFGSILYKKENNNWKPYPYFHTHE